MIKVTFDLIDTHATLGVDPNRISGQLFNAGIPVRKIVADLRPGESMRCTVILMDHEQTLEASRLLKEEYWWGTFVD